MFKKCLAIAATVLAICSCSRTTSVDKTISLAGEWRFALDSTGIGESEEWFGKELPDLIQMPGSCEQRGYGIPAKEATVGRLTRVIRYEGKAWY